MMIIVIMFQNVNIIIISFYYMYFSILMINYSDKLFSLDNNLQENEVYTWTTDTSQGTTCPSNVSESMVTLRVYGCVPANLLWPL